MPDDDPPHRPADLSLLAALLRAESITHSSRRVRLVSL